MTNSKNKLAGVLLAALMTVSAVTAPAFMTTNDLTESASIVQTIEANAAGTYNSTNAVNYAKKYWNNYNPNYRNFNSVGGDCANFVSQCLKAGGLKTDGTWNCYSLAWVNCQAQLNYLKSQGYKTTDWAKASDLQVGDVVYYYNGSTICHTAICTKVANGQAYVTAHNKNHIDYEWTLGGSKWWGGSNRRVVVHMTKPIPPNPWVTPLINGGIYYISPACATGSLLDISGGASNKKDGANVQIYTAHWGTNQQFKATLKGNSYVFEAVSSGKALDASKTTTNVQQWATHSGNNQKWYLKEAGNGYYYVVSCANTNNYLDVNGAGNKNGTNVQIYPSNGTNAQKFKFILKDDDITWDTFFKSGQYIQTYALSNSRQIPVYSNANLSSPEKGRYIYGDTDLLYVYKVAKNSSGKWYAYVSYPTSGGRRKVYVPLSTITTETQLKTARSATAKITTYKKANNTSFGYIDKGDRLWYAGKSGNYTRVIYPVTNGYKMAFIKTTDYNNKTK